MDFADRHTYTTKPGSAVLFPTLCLPTGTLWRLNVIPLFWPTVG